MSERIANVHGKYYNGRYYRSTLEADTAEVLDKLGIPYSYEEKKIELISSFRCPFQKDMVRSLTYKPDFILGSIILECKGFETPEWKIKKKLVYKWLMKNEPTTLFYQTHDAKKSLLEVLDKHWLQFGYVIEVASKPTKKKESETLMYDSVRQAMESLGLKGKPLGSILSSLLGERDYVFGYKWKLKNINL